MQGLIRHFIYFYALLDVCIMRQTILFIFCIKFKQGLVTLKESLFYVGQILLQLEYLHFHQIIYRDLKPENIIVKANGYLSLIDMGTAKFLQRKSPKDVIRTFTVLGSPHYLAPEIMEGKGYSFEVDIYSLGIFLNCKIYNLYNRDMLL